MTCLSNLENDMIGIGYDDGKFIVLKSGEFRSWVILKIFIIN